MEKDNLRERYSRLGGKVKEIHLNKCIRVNNLKVSTKELRRLFRNLGIKIEEIPFTKNGFYILKSKFSVGAIPEYLLGYYYIQKAAAQIPAEILATSPNDFVLDMAAAPGGKTIQMADMMMNKGIIIALDLKQRRLIALKNNMERCGIKNTIVYNYNSIKFTDLGLKFDKIMLDAPCSGNYTMEENWFAKRDLEGINRNAELQKRLLRSGFSMLKDNGTLVYSTCSLEPEENELVVDYCLRHFDVRLEKFKSIGDPGLTHVFGKKLDNHIEFCRRFWPHKTKTQGFFIAKFRKGK